MAATFRIYQPSDLEALRALVHDPSLAPQFDILLGPRRIEAWLADPFHDPQLHWMAFEDGEPAGFGAGLVIPGRAGKFVVVRLGVIGRFRRTGLGTRLLERVTAGADQRHADATELATTFWLPEPASEAFTAAHGFQRARTFWLMERPPGAPHAPEWPAGIRLAGHDGSEANYRDLADAYNDSFSQHYHAVITNPEDMRAFYTLPGFRTDGYVRAYRGEECVGFCRCDVHADRGEIAILGTTHAARGIGLGRALLRWGVQWLEREGAARITLVVDGDNENALRLYRSEGFEIVRTRPVMARERVSAKRT